jgi:chromosomal replication initiator protein
MKKATFTDHVESIPLPQIMEGKSKQTHVTSIQKGKPQYDSEDVWKMLKEQLKMYVSQNTFKSWYSDVYIEKIENGVAVLSSKNPLARQWIEDNHKQFIRSKLKEITGQEHDIMMTSRTSEVDEKSDNYEYYDPSTGEHFQQPNMFAESAHPQVQSSAPPSSLNANPHFQSTLNPKYTMDKFVVGSGNQLAFAVGEGIVAKPGSVYNPVFFYGPSGVGKTHLMQAIGNSMTMNDASTRIVYVPIETFMNELIGAIRTRKNEEFRQKYRSADLLIIDDIQFISTYKKTREELFNTFNALYQTNKQIIIASDRPPKEIDNLPDRLRTRFEGGMVVDIQPPDLETRIAILQQKIEETDVEIPSETVMFIAQNIESSVRELEGAITKVITHSQFTNQPLTQVEVARMLQVDIDTKRRRIKPDRIISAVADVFDVSIREIRGKRRTAYIAVARQSAMFLLREELELPLDKVASLVNRKDHTTVLHACNKVELLIKEDGQMKERIELCRSVIRQ